MGINEEKKAVDISVYQKNMARKIRENKSQKEISRALDMSPATINSLAQGTRDPKLSTMVEICNFIGETLDSFTGYKLPEASPDETDLSPKQALEQMKGSLAYLARDLSGIANFKRSEETDEIVAYVRGSIETILDGEKLFGERPDVQDKIKKQMVIKTGAL